MYRGNVCEAYVLFGRPRGLYKAQDKVTQKNYINEISLYRAFLKGPRVAKQNKKPDTIHAPQSSQSKEKRPILKHCRLDSRNIL